MNWLKQLWCALRGHGGVTFTPHLDHTDYRCKRCGAEWSEDWP